MASPTEPSASRSVFLGVDVGTGSARAGLFDEEGKLLGSSSSPIQIWKDGAFVEQSSTDIWLAVCVAVKAACSKAKVAPAEVKSLGFAATCSLVAVDSDSSPVSVSRSGDSRRNVIVWMDHRAVDQAERINTSKSPALEYCGGAVSPEMQPPKLLWVKENLQESWSMVFRWMDLSDWLSYRATGDDTRSLCTTVCKWTYLGHAHMQYVNDTDSRDMEACGWDDEFWEEIGLGDLVEGHHAKIGRSVAFPGHPLGSGLTPTAAKELGLLPGIPVGTSLIDAHAGGVGVIESVPLSETEENDKEAICNRMVLVCGTSTCHMAVSRSKLFIPGIWGPFWSAMVPEYWLTEGGQSATGALLDHIIENHAGSIHLANRAASQKISVFELLNKLLETIMTEQNQSFIGALTEYLHVLPDFHGNRSPIADPKSKGVIYGLTLDTSDQQLALLYLATVQGIAYGTRHIVEHCNAHGHKINTLLACGGLSKNPIYIQEHADIIGCPIILPRESESVLLGAAILGAVATKKYNSLREAMKALNAAGQVIHPSNDPTRARDQNLVSNGKDEDASLSEVSANSIVHGETDARDQNLINNGKDGHAILSETAENLIVDGEPGIVNHKPLTNAKDEQVNLSEANLSQAAVSSIIDGEIDNRGHNLVNDANDEQVNLSEALVYSNGYGETSTRDLNLVNNANDDHASISETASNSIGDGEIGTRDHNLVNDAKDEQSVTVDWNGDVEVPIRDLNLVKSAEGEPAQPMESADGQSTNMDSNGHLPNGKECDISDETIKKLKEENAMLIQRETISEETIHKLKEEIDTHILKGVMSEETIRKLNEDNNMHILKETISEETIRKLEEQKDMHVEKEVALEESIRKLKKEIEMHVKKEAILEDTIRKLNKENDTHMQKEATSKETIRNLEEENEVYIQKEAKAEETIAKLKEAVDKHIHKEVTMEEIINKLQTENELQKQKQTDLEVRIAQLQNENNSLLQKEAGLAEKTNLLLNEKAGLVEKVNMLLNEKEGLVQKVNILESNLSSFSEKEAGSVDTTNLLLKEKEGLEQKLNILESNLSSFSEKETGLEMRIAQLQSETNSLLQKETGFVEKTNQLLNEKNILRLKVDSLERKIIHVESDLSSFVEKENSTEEVISNLNGSISMLQGQVAELEESKNNLLLENQQLRENVSGLHSTIQNLENSSFSSASQDASVKDRASENEELKSQIEEAYMLVEKLMAENAELVEKVHMLCVELDRPDTEIKLSEVTGPDGLTEFVKPSEPESSEATSISVLELDSLEKTLVVNDNSDSIHAEHAGDLQLVPDDIEEIVQIPLDDNDVRDLQLQDTKNVENDDAVPITDAPLIGAPFRLISFFAKYVSGADLVSQNSSNTIN